MKTLPVAIRSPRDVHKEIQASSKTPEFRLGLHLGLIVATLLAALVLAIQPLI